MQARLEQLNGSTYRHILTSGEKVEVGNAKAADFKPSIRLSRWDDESNLSVSLPIAEKGSFEARGERIHWRGSKIDCQFYPLEPSEDNRLGGYEFEIILKEKPASNRIELDIDMTGLVAYYQASLIQQFKSGWSDEYRREVVVTETDVRTANRGQIVYHRPEHVVGSYAFYHATRKQVHKSKADAEKYRVGKAFHAYRWLATNALGEKVWASYLHLENGKLSASIPQDFLDRGPYPIAIDPSFGYQERGDSYWRLSSPRIYGSLHEGHNGFPRSITIFVNSVNLGSYGGRTIRCALYKHESGLTGHEYVPRTDTGSWLVPRDTWEGWKELECGLNPEISELEWYWICFITPKNMHQYTTCYIMSDRYYYDDQSPPPTPPSAYRANTSSWPGYLDFTEGWDRILSIYCTYELEPIFTLPSTVSDIAHNAATIRGNFVYDGWGNAEQYGFVWDTVSRDNPGGASPEASDYANSWSSDLGDYESGIYPRGIEGLDFDTRYYFRFGVYVDTVGEWRWSDEATFDTLTEPTLISEVGTCTRDSPTQRTPQRKTFIAQGREWVVYSDGSNLVYKSRTIEPLGSWTDPVTIVSESYGHNLAIAWSGVTLHLARASAHYACTPNADGSMAIGDVTGIASYHYNPHLAVDSAGYPVAGLRWLSSSYNRHEPRVVIATATDGSSWGSSFALRPYVASAYDFSPLVVPLPGRALLAMFRDTDNNLKSRYYNGASWSGLSTIVSLPESWKYSAVAIANKVLLVVYGAANKILGLEWTPNSWSSSVEISEGSIATISKNGNQAYAFVRDGTKLYTVLYDDGWQTRQEIADIGTIGPDLNLTSDYEGTDNRIDVVWYAAGSVWHAVFQAPPVVAVLKGVVTLYGVGVEGAKLYCIQDDTNECVGIQYSSAPDGAYRFSGLDMSKRYHITLEYEHAGIRYRARSHYNLAPEQET